MGEQTFLELLAQDLRECLWEVWWKTNEIPIYGKQTYGYGKATNGHALELWWWRSRHIQGTFKTVPPNERHRVKDFERFRRNLANGQDPDEGLDEIDLVMKELEEEEREHENRPEPENWTNSKNSLKKQWPYIVRGCYLLIKTVDVVRKNWLT